MIFAELFFSLFSGLRLGTDFIRNLVLLGTDAVLLSVLLLRKKKKELLLCSAFFLFGLLFALFFQKGNLAPGREYFGIVVKAKENYFLFFTSEGVLYVPYKNSPYGQFDLLVLKGKAEELGFSHYEGSFDFKEYLKSYGCYKQCAPSSVRTVFAFPFRLLDFKKSLLSPYSEAAQAFLGSMLFADSVTDAGLSYILQSLGIVTFLRASALHLTSLIYLLNRSLEPKLGRVKSRILLLPIPLLYAFFQGFSPSSLRVLFLFVLSFFEDGEKRALFTYPERLSLTGMLVLLFYPFSVLSASFLYTYPPLFIAYFLRNSFPKRKSRSKPVFAFSFLLLFFPYELISAHSYNPLHLLVNSFVSPLFSFLFLLDLSAFLGKISVPFNEILNSGVANLLKKADTKYFAFGVPELSWDFLYLFDGFVLLIVLSGELRLTKIKKYLTAFFACSLLLLFVPFQRCTSEVDFIDVGQGDSTLVLDKNCSVLIDTGGLKYCDLATGCLIPFLRSKQVYSLDYVLTTHGDYDHCGALDSLTKHFPVKHVYKGGEIEGLDVGPFYIKDLNRYRGDDMEKNYNSAVYSFSVRNTSFLIMGDAPKEIEKKIIADDPGLRCDVLKVGHHGSDSSSSEEFLKRVSPKIAVISCGYKNFYGHPHQATIDTLRKLGIPYVRTDESGTYTYRLEG